MNSSSSGSLSSVPNGRIIDFETAELRKPPFQDSLYLWVRGTLPGNGFEVRLAPRVYIIVPGPANDVGGADSTLEFERSVPLTGITGVRGITVIGANQVKRIEIAGES
jgi:hypothetical protein